jgi:pSer/pThr/pTyr-binding forkhead associated (FHA) protein
LYLCIHISGDEPDLCLEFRSGDSFVVGRGADCDVVIPDPEVSRKHFRVEVNGRHGYLEDLGSRNRTVVNGFRVSHAFLKDGDVIDIGQCRISISESRPEDDESTTMATG